MSVIISHAVVYEMQHIHWGYTEPNHHSDIGIHRCWDGSSTHTDTLQHCTEAKPFLGHDHLKSTATQNELQKYAKTCSNSFEICFSVHHIKITHTEDCVCDFLHAEVNNFRFAAADVEIAVKYFDFSTNQRCSALQAPLPKYLFWKILTN